MAAPQLVVRVAADLKEFRKNLQEGVVGQIEVTKSALVKMASSYDGSKIIQQAGLTAAAIQQIGGVSALTDADMRRANVTLEAALEKYKKLGKEAPPGMQALADATRKVEVANKAADTSIGGIGNTAAGTTNRFGQLRDGVSQVDRVLASMGINIGPQVGALTELSAAAGKTASQIGLIAVAGLALAAGAAGWQIGSLIAQYTQADEALGDWLANVVGWSPAAQEAAAVNDVLARATANAGREITSYTEAISINNEAARKHSAQFVDFEKELAAAEKRVNAITKEEWAQIEAANALGKSTEQLTAKLGLNAAELAVMRQRLQENAAAEKEAEQAAAKHAAALVELRSAGDGWRGTLAGIKADTVEEIQRYLEAGVAQGTLQLAYQLTATQVKAIATALQEQKKAHEEAERAAEKQAQAVEKATMEMAQLWNDHNAVMLSSNLSTHTVLLSRIEEWKQKQITAAQEAGLYTEEVQAQIASAATERFEREKVNIDALREHSKTYMQEQAAEAQAAYEFVKNLSDEFTPAFIEQKRLEAEAARQSANDWGTAFADSMNNVKAKSDEATAHLLGNAQRAALTWSEAMSLVSQGKGTMTMTVMHQPVSTEPWGRRAEGGPVTAGQPYIVGEKRPELFVPERSGFVLPSVPSSFGGGMGGGSTVINNYITVEGSVVTERDLVRSVKEGLMADWRARGGRNASGA